MGKCSPDTLVTGQTRRPRQRNIPDILDVLRLDTTVILALPVVLLFINILFGASPVVFGFPQSKGNQELGVAENSQNMTSLEEVLFEDDFDSENGGKGQVEYQAFGNWQIVRGKVDLADGDSSQQHPQNGLWLALSSAPDEIGILQSNKEFSLSTGIYRLELDIGCSAPCAGSKIKLSIGNVYSELLSLQENADFQTVKREILVWAAATAGWAFHFQTAENAKVLLDSIRFVKFSDGNEVFNYVPPHEPTKYEEPEPDQQLTENDDERTSYFGAVFKKHTGEGIRILGVLDDTPAQFAGLRADDLILEVEDVSFRDKGAAPSVFSEMVQHLPSDKPLRFHVERGGKQFDVWIKPVRLDSEQLVAVQKLIREKFSSNHDKGSRMIAQGNYTGAIEYFKKSLESRPMESYQGLGISYYHLAKYKEARKNIEKAYKLDRSQPLNVFYVAACRDVLGKRNTAAFHYKEFLQLNHDDAEMNDFATRRLEELKETNKKNWGDQLRRIFDTIAKEIEDY